MAMAQTSFRTRQALNHHSMAATRRSQRAEMPLFQAFLRPSSVKVTDGLCIKDVTSIDPAAGTGNFFSVIPPALESSRLHGVELDGITGRIARLLYPDADIRVQGFEQTSFDDDTFDIAVGNVPFANFKVDDREYEEEYLLHDYFFIKSLDKLKPGGIAAFITSSGTLDKNNIHARLEIANRAELIGAVRLPDNAFKAIAGTDVTTDIVFLKKREQPQNYSTHSYDLPLWVKQPECVYKANGDLAYYCNPYYCEHPEMVLGEQKMVTGRFGMETKCKAIEGTDLTEALQNALKSLQAEFTAKPAESTEETSEDNEEEKLPAPEDSQNYCFYVNESNELFYREGEYIAPSSLPQKSQDAIKAMCGLCDRMQKVIDVQLVSGYADEELKEAQKALSDDYDAFVTKYGFVNKAVNSNLFHDDLRSSLLLSLEKEADGIADKYIKADIFSKATVAPKMQIEKAESAQEALEISLNIRNKVDIPYMAALCGKSEDAVISDLGNRIYQDPAEYDGSPYSGWETAEEYLSGYVKDKLGTAMQFAKEYPDLFERNVTALEDNQPAPLTIADIDFSVGAVFIPTEMYRDFMYETFETPLVKRAVFGRSGINIEYSSLLNQWKITNKGYDIRLQVDEVYGTKRVNAYEIFESSLNQKKVTVKDPVEYFNQKGEKAIKYVINKNETHIARMRQTKIEAEFKKWIIADPDRVKRIEEIYNNRFNNIKVRKYDGGYIRLQGLNPQIKLRPHQLNAIARIASGSNVMLAHEVGAGKTAVMAGAGMYLKSIGAAKKPLYVVPKPIVAQWGREFARFFPTAKILVTDEKDFEKKNRRRFLAKIAAGDYDAVIMAQSQFERIPLSFERQEKFLQEKRSQLVRAKEKARTDGGKNAFTPKQFAAAIKGIDKKLQKLQANFKKDDFISFESLGCDCLFVDEAHAYKNLYTPTKHTNVAGINSNADSQRAFDMEIKASYINEINGSVVMATGTPISNSIAECYVFQHFLQRPMLQKMGIDNFDEWSSVFGNIATALEVKPTGSGWRMRERFSEFKNLPELCNMLSCCFDLVKTSEIEGLDLPEVVGGKPECIVCEQTEEQAEQVEIGMKRAELIEAGAVNAAEDNMLAVCSYMTKVSLDPRINDPEAEDCDCMKVNVCADEILQINEQNPHSAQVVFCDTSTPKGGEDFTVYKALKERLLKSGQYKPDEIAFVHDAKNDRQRLALFDKVNSGKIKVIIGSTSKLGTGVNMQHKLIAAHHLDAPYVPKDVEQRNGRIVRQGNENDKVYIKYYSTKGTFDSYRWQLLEKKQRLIAQILSGKPPARSCQDVDETALTFAEMKAAASDNPLIAEKMQVDNEAERLKLLQHDWLDQQARYKFDIETGQPMKIENLQKRIAKLDEDIGLLKENRQGKDSFTITIGNTVYAERPEAGKALITQWGRYMSSEQRKSFSPSEPIGKYKGFDISYHEQGTTPIIRLTGKSGIIYENVFAMSDVGICVRLENIVNGIPERKEAALADIRQSEKELESAKQEYGKPFEYAEELDRLLLRQSEINSELELGSQQEQREQQEIIIEGIEEEEEEGLVM